MNINFQSFFLNLICYLLFTGHWPCNQKTSEGYLCTASSKFHMFVLCQWWWCPWVQREPSGKGIIQDNSKILQSVDWERSSQRNIIISTNLMTVLKNIVYFKCYNNNIFTQNMSLLLLLSSSRHTKIKLS